MRKGRTIRNRRLARRARRPVAAFLRVVARHGAAMARHGWHGRPEPLLPCSRLFTIVHDCSPLFSIVQQKILRLSQCPLSVLTGNAACKVFTNHESRDTNHSFYGFHESRDTRHESRPWLWRGMGGYGAAWAAYCPRAGVLATSAVLGGLAPFAAVPVALRAHAAVANAKGTHVEKGERSGLHKQGNFRYRVDTPGMIPGSASGRRCALRSGVGRTPEPCTAGRPRRLGCGRRAGFFTMLTRRGEPRR